MTLDVARTLQMLVELFLCTGPICHGLPRRGRWWLRAVAAFALVFLLEMSRAPLRLYGFETGERAFITLFGFACTLGELFLAVLLCYEASPWQAVFCCTAGCATQNLLNDVEGLLRMLGVGAPGAGMASGAYWLPVVLAFALTYPFCPLAFARTVRARGLLDVEDRKVALCGLGIVFGVIGFSVALSQVPVEVVGLPVRLMMLVAHGTICVFFLLTERQILEGRQLATEREVERRLAAERERQYRLSRSTIDAINIKVHDIKHQIRTLAQGRAVDQAVLDDIADEVRVYESALDTGNPALDTILTEKGLICSREGITLSVIADGAAIGFLAPAETYALFGNALDNAIEATRAVGDPERRVIALDVRRRHDMVGIRVENPCEGEPVFVDGLPQTTKGDTASHGFGTRSMRALVEAHDGIMQMGVRDGRFYVDALIPLPETRGAGTSASP